MYQYAQEYGTTWTQYTGPPHRVEEFELRGRGWAVDGYPNELHEDLHQRFAVVNDLAQRISKVKATSAAVNLKRGRDESAEPPSKRRKPLLDVSKIHDHDTTKYPQAYTNATSRTTPSIHPVGRYSLPPPPASPISSVEDTEAYMQPEEDEESSPSPTPARPKLFDGYLKLDIGTARKTSGFDAEAEDAENAGDSEPGRNSLANKEDDRNASIARPQKRTFDETQNSPRPRKKTRWGPPVHQDSNIRAAKNKSADTIGGDSSSSSDSDAGRPINRAPAKRRPNRPSQRAVERWKRDQKAKIQEARQAARTALRPSAVAEIVDQAKNNHSPPKNDYSPASPPLDQWSELDLDNDDIFAEAPPSSSSLYDRNDGEQQRSRRVHEAIHRFNARNAYLPANTISERQEEERQEQERAYQTWRNAIDNLQDVDRRRRTFIEIQLRNYRDRARDRVLRSPSPFAGLGSPYWSPRPRDRQHRSPTRARTAEGIPVYMSDFTPASPLFGHDNDGDDEDDDDDAGDQNPPLSPAPAAGIPIYLSDFAPASPLQQHDSGHDDEIADQIPALTNLSNPITQAVLERLDRKTLMQLLTQERSRSLMLQARIEELEEDSASEGEFMERLVRLRGGL
ncbi:hypothetical protein PMZ80_005522 [Knufia obscura]|uniref:Uncharacterized protein n=1 Tax=Knufia obscura TaxID=1635080 RepID=A0ABR0RNA6_9EURO|nr:hypothetical protein PMZ80_005522 [Knufia obscura]